MSASVSDLFQKLGGSSSLVNTPKVTGTRSAGGTTLAVDNCNWDTSTGKTFATYQVDVDGTVVDGTETIWRGVVASSTSIGSLTWVAGVADSGNAIGDYVELLPASAWANKLVDGLLVEHKQSGAHSDITADSVTVTGNTQFNGSYTGWIGANEGWTYSSYDATNKTGVITVPSDATTKYSAGMRVMFTQTTVKYGIITAVSSTSITVYFGTDYSLANAAISANYYSSQKAPLGFSLDPNKWTVSTTYNSDATQTATSGTWYNLGSVSLSIPIGVWKVTYKAFIDANRSGGTGQNVFITLSTANNSNTDSDFVAGVEEGGSGNTVWQPGGIISAPVKDLTLSSATTYYLNCMALSTTQTSGLRHLAATYYPSYIKAVCTYL